MTLTVTPLYAAALTALFLVLSWRVISYRRAHQVSLGDGGDPMLERRMRAQGNFAEYAPIGLILLLGAELAGAPGLWLHLTGLLLLTGRLMHGVGFSFFRQNIPLRVGGMVLTLTSLIVGAVSGLVASL
jgi:uncharacterized membrane protein YecN with MAPEG domain